MISLASTSRNRESRPPFALSGSPPPIPTRELVTYNLLRERWIPFRRASGEIEWGNPSLISDRIETNPVVALATPRPDFDGALLEFLIGLLCALDLAEDESDWHKRWNSPPPAELLRERMDTLDAAFNLDGDGPRFMQDSRAGDLASEAPEPIQDLLVNAKNSGVFVKPATVPCMGRPAAAMALITMQTYSPAGGRGYRTSVRGGGPLTTLVRPQESGPEHVLPLWHLLWANVETNEQLQRRAGTDELPTDLASIFPWMAPTRTSEPKTGKSTTPENAHPLQAYFALPRRLRLEFRNEPGTCDLTGQGDERTVGEFRGKSYGVQYVRWIHPLSPYYRGKEVNELLPVHGQPGGISWREWLSLLYGNVEKGREPATVVAHFMNRRAERLEQRRLQLRVFGYDLTNAKARAWTDTSVPAFASAPARVADVARVADGAVLAAERVAYVLESAVAEAQYADDDVRGDTSHPKRELWSETEGDFYARVGVLVDATDFPEASQAFRESFRDLLRERALAIFDRHVQLDTLRPETWRRSLGARRSLAITLSGGGKIGEQIYEALRLVTPAAKRKRKDDPKPSKEKAK